MPTSKPQVMWMAKMPNGELNAHYTGYSQTQVKLMFNGWPTVSQSWLTYKAEGWRIVKVEVRETKKEKK